MCGEPEVPKGSVAVGRRVRLPNGAEPPIKVFVNGVEQTDGGDYRLQGEEIVFARPILKEGRLGAMRWLSMFIGLVGSYRKHETVDVEYHVGGEAKLASDVEVLPDEPEADPHEGRRH
jgi:hypothetical protein